MTTLFAAIAMLILLAVTSMRFGVDSREGFPNKERDLASRSIIWIDPPRARDPQPANHPRPLRQQPVARARSPEARAA